MYKWQSAIKHGARKFCTSVRFQHNLSTDFPRFCLFSFYPCRRNFTLLYSWLELASIVAVASRFNIMRFILYMYWWMPVTMWTAHSSLSQAKAMIAIHWTFTIYIHTEECLYWTETATGPFPYALHSSHTWTENYKQNQIKQNVTSSRECFVNKFSRMPKSCKNSPTNKNTTVYDSNGWILGTFFSYLRTIIKKWNCRFSTMCMVSCLIVRIFANFAILAMEFWLAWNRFSSVLIRFW